MSELTSLFEVTWPGEWGEGWTSFRTYEALHPEQAASEFALRHIWGEAADHASPIEPHGDMREVWVRAKGAGEHIAFDVKRPHSDVTVVTLVDVFAPEAAVSLAARCYNLTAQIGAMAMTLEEVSAGRQKITPVPEDVQAAFDVVEKLFTAEVTTALFSLQTYLNCGEVREVKP